MPKLTIQTSPFRTPAWSSATLDPGVDVTLTVDAPKITADQHVDFRILDSVKVVDVISSDPGKATATWKVPNQPHSPNLTFDAVLIEKPTPKNGHRAVIAKVTSPAARLRGFKVEITSMDAAFAPKAEKLQAVWQVTDAHRAAKSGRIEVWGERDYPGNKPLYTKSFTPANGNKTWQVWRGTAADGILSGKHLTPELSPYRLRIIIGPDQASVDDAFGVGAGKVAIAERLFEVRFKSIRVLLQQDLEANVKTAMKTMLVVEPRTEAGVYAAKGRLPLEVEQPSGLAGIGRIRIQNARHTAIPESLSQGSSNAGDPAAGGWQHRVADSYMDDNDNPPGGVGQTKFAIDTPLYTRPELPLQIEARLESQDPAKNASPEFGIFRKEVVGPALFDLIAEDLYRRDPYWVSGTNASKRYFRRAAMCVKRGAHDTPFRVGTNAKIEYWQQRFEVTTDGKRDFDTDRDFVVGANELTVWLNHTKLKLAVDYTESNTKRIRLKAGFSKTNDIVWINRTPAAPGQAVANWVSWPPGDNCHKHYGGIRGVPPTASEVSCLRSQFSAAPSGSEPIAGKGTQAFPFTAAVNLNPANVPAADRELVVSQALTSGTFQGLAGVIFSPSVIGGDSYRVRAAVTRNPYLRDFGYVYDRPIEPVLKGSTGDLVVWRLLKIAKSMRLPLQGTAGLLATVGEQDAAVAGRTHPANGRGVTFSNAGVGINPQGALAFNEWLCIKKAGAADAHRDVSLTTYRNFFKNERPALGYYEVTSNATLTDRFMIWDHYRWELPPGIPLDRVNVASLAIEGLPNGTSPTVAMNTVDAAITARNTSYLGIGKHLGDIKANKLANAPIPRTPATNAAAYYGRVKEECKRMANKFMDQLFGNLATPRVMNILRWPEMFWADVWSDGTPGAMGTTHFGLAGYCRGGGQAMFFSVGGNPDTFEHEMGHSVFLAHFAAGSKTNFCWKHHDHGYPQCLMGYYSGAFDVALPAAAVGAAINITTGGRQWLCAKCLLKLRGWNELLLPCNWDHPDVF